MFPPEQTLAEIVRSLADAWRNAKDGVQVDEEIRQPVPPAHGDHEA
jgi:hypothetical protein